MTAMEDLGTSTRAAIVSGSGIAATISALQGVFGTAPKPRDGQNGGPGDAKGARAKTAPKTTKSITPARKSTKEGARVEVLQDQALSLSSKEKHALATDVINISLKILTELAKARKDVRDDSKSAQDSTSGITSPPRPSTQERALKSRQGNAVSTPRAAKASPDCRSPARHSRESSEQELDHAAGVAECARAAFAYLRTTDMAKPSAETRPRFQLETGILAFVARLISLGLRVVAEKELRIFKHRMEKVWGVSRRPETQTSTRTITADDNSSKETLATLLNISLDVERVSELLPLAITYQSHVIRLLTMRHKPSLIDEVAQHLRGSENASPISYIQQFARSKENADKAVRHFDQLSRGLSSLCPSLASSADSVARDPEQSPLPQVAFEIQCLALHSQKQMWKLADHKVDMERELLQPFSRCQAAAIRRSSSSEASRAIYEISCRAYEDLEINTTLSMESESVPSCFAVHRTLSLLAEQIGQYEEAEEWTTNAAQCCEALEARHSRSLAAECRKIALFLQRTIISSAILANAAGALTHNLQAGPSGTSHDFETLVSELAHVISLSTSSAKRDAFGKAYPTFLSASVAFSLRFARTYPERAVDTITSLLNTALAESQSDVIRSWINKDACAMLCASGAIRRVAADAKSLPLTTAWSSSRAGLALARALKALTLRSLSLSSDNTALTPFDDESLTRVERGILLEWQMKCAADVAHKLRYQPSLRRLLPELLERLVSVYPVQVHPIRRARALVTAVEAQESVADLFSADYLRDLLEECELNESNLFDDQNLASYTSDLRATVAMARVFNATKPIAADLFPSIQIWQSLLEKCDSSQSVRSVIEAPDVLARRLGLIEEYLAASGVDAARITVARVLACLTERAEQDIKSRTCALVKLAKAYLANQLAEQAMSTLKKAKFLITAAGDDAALAAETLQCHLCCAEAQLMHDDYDACQESLIAAKIAREACPPESVASNASKTYKLLHGKGWLLQSEFAFAVGSQREALRTAKRAVKIMNSIWAGLDRTTQPSVDVSNVSGVDVDEAEALTNKISKLDLTGKKYPAADADAAMGSEKGSLMGAAKWPVIRLLCRSLLHLSNVYRHHGTFLEAKYYSEQAMKVAKAIGSCEFAARIRYHHARLLLAAGCLEDAELCLSSETQTWLTPSFTLVEQRRTLAAFAAANGELAKSACLLQQARQAAEELRSSAVSSFSNDVQAKTPVTTKQRSTTTKTATKRAPARPSSVAAKSRQAETSQKTVGSGEVACYAIEKLCKQLDAEVQSLALRTGTVAIASLPHSVQEKYAESADRQILFQALAQEMSAAIESNFSFAVLPESTLSVPALLRQLEIRVPAAKTKQPASTKSRAVAKKTTSAKTVVKTSAEQDGLAECWMYFTSGNYSKLTTSTMDMHVESTLLSNMAMLMSVSKTAPGLPTSTSTAYAIELAKSHASESYARVALTDIEHEAKDQVFSWPQGSELTPGEAQQAINFQRDYIDILPSSWTAVSLTLNDTSDELYLTRYRASQPPLVLRLPFARHKPDTEDDELFDFHTGREELAEIIELSNYSCHNAGDVSVKGARSKWWEERENLDRRLHELLINMEGLWLGGFRGVLSSRRCETQLLERLRKAFENVLNRHLPSRRAQRGVVAPGLMVDDQILELFANLGNDDTQDLDEALSDLLYFVVDLLQFNGEANAYDEIDFDAMVVDTLDALRSYHDAIEEEDKKSEHLILVLDRRLHAFPWESMPCLEGSSVSRVDSMMTLRDRVVAMRAVKDRDAHVVARSTGCYVLNPSKDLQNTQATLGPSLQAAAGDNSSNWTSIVSRSPSEEELVSALSTTAMMLYFGHGAGSQYIRPRAVRRLGKCSEVVWLMGCSSGAVTEHARLEPSMVPLSYLVAGGAESEGGKTERQSKCMAVVATLWDVTDKDIDRFSLALGEEWGLWEGVAVKPAAPVVKPSRKREIVHHPTTPPRPPKTPKTPKVNKTPAPSRTPARACKTGEAKGNATLPEALARSRDSCYLRYLNGAAPVVYGIPVCLEER